MYSSTSICILTPTLEYKIW